MPESTTSLWGGRFSGKTDPLVEQLNFSISYDKRMAVEDIDGSLAYAQAIHKVGIVDAQELATLLEGLRAVRVEWEQGTFAIQPTDEDIHTANERRLTEIVGSVGGKLHTGRSRNDQVATDMRLWLRSRVAILQGHLRELLSIISQRADSEIDVLMPGYTHLQRAQAIRWSQWLLSYGFAFGRDLERLGEQTGRLNVSPLGSGALAGNPFGVDREFLAKELGFAGITHNSLDGTRDRDFVVEFLQWGSLCSAHLSSMAEDLIIYCTKEFAFVRLADAYSTGSSLMPQKKNPDSLELIRGKAGRVNGISTGFVGTLKGLPTTYNKDLQDDKIAMFEVFDTMDKMIQIMAGVLATLTIEPTAMLAALTPDMLATDLAYYLVRKGVPFREAHGVAGLCVKASEDKACKLSDLTLSDYVAIHAQFEADVLDMWNFEASAEQYSAAGGTSKQSCVDQIAALKRIFA